ncbi:MAG TPA: amidohydrolase family protein [Candidatus Acidoferrum sp.]|nr:amidohydrolase family protein [Candidatus Acidoferrum sp.]
MIELRARTRGAGRFTLVAAGIFVVAFALGGATSAGAQDASYEVVIANGRVMDPESGLDGVRNVGISGGKVRAISNSVLKGKQTIDAKGLVVAPGFIDLHEHGQDDENYRAKAHDGVTTALELEVGVGDVDRWYGEREGKALINFGASAGHIPARMMVMHDPGQLLPSGDAAHREATPEEMQQVMALIEKGLKRGAVAVGVGPAYTEAATNWEIVQVFRVAAKYHASCHIHIRAGAPKVGEPAGNFPGFEEAMAAAAISGAPLHIVHIQSTGGPNVVYELQMISEARSRGMDVTTEAYPYTMGMTSIQAAFLDHKENEPDSYFAPMLWPATGEHLTRESFLRYRKEGGMIILPSNTQENIDAAIESPLTMIASDGALFNGKGHPRTAGTYARVLGVYVREKKALDLMTALKKMTLMPAQRLEKRAPVFKDKGRIRVGADADITVFHARTVIDKATYEKPLQYSEGIRFVLVHGVPVVKDGQLVDGVFPGRAARAPITQ